MLMIVLDATIVNVALPSIQDDLGFAQTDLAWVVNGYLIAFGGLLCSRAGSSDLIGQRRIFLIGLAVFTGASPALRARAEPGLLIGARFVQGVGGALTSAVILGMIVTMFPAAPGAGEGDWDLHLRRRRRRLDRAPARRCAHPGDQLALDLLRQPPDRAGDGAVRDQAWSPIARAWPHRGSRPARRGAAHGRPDARRVHHPRRSPRRAGDRARPSRSAPSARPAGGVRPAPGPHRQSADAPKRLFRLATSRAPISYRPCSSSGCSGCSSWGPCTCSGSLATTPRLLAAPPTTVVMGTMSFRFTGQLNLRFGPQATSSRRWSSSSPGCCSWRAPVDANYAIDLMPAMIPIGLGAGLGFPSLMTLAMSGATASDSGLASAS